MVLPYQILKPIVEKAGGHMLLGRCPCRNGEGAVHTRMISDACSWGER